VFAATVLHRTPVLAVHPSPPRPQHLQALVLALCCALLFLRDALLPGRALVPYPPEQMGIVRAEALADGSFDPGDARRGLACGGDKYLQSLCWDRVMQRRFRAGEFPLWTRDIAGGAPFVPQMAQVYQPINALLLVLPSEQWYGWWYLVHQVLFGYFAWRFLRRIGCAQPAALLGLVAAGLGLWTQCKLHHNVILTAALPLWPMLGAVHELVAGAVTGRAARRAVAWLGAWTGISWLSGFAVVSLQVTYLTVGFAAFASASRPRGERLRALLPVGAGLLLGGLLSSAQMIPVLQAAAISARGSGWDPAFLAAHGLEWDHALAALWPDLLSWSSDPFYPDPHDPFGDVTRMPWSQLVLLAQPTSQVTGAPFQSWAETSFAVGTLPLACVLLALGDRSRRGLVLFFGLAGLCGFGFATADEPFLSLARFVPGIASADLRRLLFTVAMALVVLAGLGADRLLAGARRWPAFLVLGPAAAGALAALAWLQGDLARGVAGLIALDGDHPYVRAAAGDAGAIAASIRAAMAPGEQDWNGFHLHATALRSLLAAALGAVALLWLCGRARAAALIALTALELLSFGFGPVQTVPAARVNAAPLAVAPMFAAAEPNGLRPRLGRLAPATEARESSWYPGNLPGFHGLEDATGYNPLPAARFEEFFRAIEPDRAGKADVAFGGGGTGVGAFHDPASLAHPLCDLFGIRFVLTREPLPPGPHLADRTPPGTGGYRLYERLTTLPRATFVREIDRVPDRAERLALLARPGRDVARRTVLEHPGAVAPAPKPASPARVTVVAHADERVTVRVATEADGYLRLADPYDPGWRATVDGYQTEVLAADHYLRAVYVKASDQEQEIVFTYDGARTVWPRHVSLLALLAIAWLAFVRPRRRT